MINWTTIITNASIMLMTTGLVFHFENPRFLWLLLLLLLFN